MSTMTAEKIDTINACFGTYPQTQALKSGQIKSDRVKLNLTEVNPVYKAFSMMVREQKFDICEMAIVSYLQGKAYGKPLTLMPATMVGRFQHGTMLYNSERGTVTPNNLEGRRIGVRSFAQTTGCWLRGILWKDYGLDNSKVKWVTFEDAHIPEFKDPPGVERAADGKDMTKMVLDGELDAAIFGTVLPPDPRLKSVIANPDAAPKEWYKKYNTVPINHMVGGKTDGVKSEPGEERLAEIRPRRGPRSCPYGARQQESRRPAQARRHRHAAVRLRCSEARTRADVELRAGDEDHSAALFGRGIIRRHHAGAIASSAPATAGAES